MINNIPLIAVVMLGIGATLKYAYQVFYLGIWKSSGALITMFYLTLLYLGILYNHEITEYSHIFVRVGICMVFVDKIMVFFYELLVKSFPKILCRFKDRRKVNRG